MGLKAILLLIALTLTVPISSFADCDNCWFCSCPTVNITISK